MYDKKNTLNISIIYINGMKKREAKTNCYNKVKYPHHYLSPLYLTNQRCFLIGSYYVSWILNYI